MSQPPARQSRSASTTISLLRALAALGPRLHEPLPAGDAAAVFTLACETLRECGLFAHIALLDAAGMLRITATSLDPQARAFIEGLIGTSFLGYPISQVGPYATVMATEEAVVIESVVAMLAPIVPHLSDEQRAALAAGVAADRALLAPIVARGHVTGVLSIWGPRARLSAEDGPVVAALGAQIGIAAENARLFREIEAERSRWRATVEDMVELVVICDADGHLTYFNASAAQVLGPPNTTASPAEQAKVYGIFRSDGMPFSSDDLPLPRALHTGEPVPSTTVTLRAKDGTERRYLWSASPLRAADGTLEGAVAVGRDVTAPELLERQRFAALRVLLRLADLATDPLARGDPAALLSRVTENLQELEAVDFTHALLVDEAHDRLIALASTGVTKAVERIWRREVAAFRLSKVPHISEVLAALRAGHLLRQSLGQEPAILAPETVRLLNVRAAITVPILDEGHLLGLLTLGRQRAPETARSATFAPWDEELLLGTGRLIGQALGRARLAAQLTATEAARLAAEEATRQRDEFLTLASHELRTPLTSLKLSLQVAERRAGRLADEIAATDGEEARRLEDLGALLARAGGAADRQARLISDLLDVSRLQAGRLEMRTTRCALDALVRESVEEQRQSEPERRITLEVAQPATVVADPDRIRQVLTNYLTNAAKYTPLDTLIAVALGVADGAARVSVRDEGPGLSLEQRARVFERFYRAPGIEHRTGSALGLGLGLYISKTIIEQHGGQVGVESASGHGATFWFTLPLAEEGA